MTQGIWGTGHKRFPTKKAMRDAIGEGRLVLLEATSYFGNEYDGPLSEAPDGDFFVVGPDPHRDRRWYAHITKKNGVVKVK